MKMRMVHVQAVALFLAVTGMIVFGSCDAKKKDNTVAKEVVIERDADGDVSDFTVYTFEQKDGVVAAAQEELDKLNKKIEELKAEMSKKGNELSADTKAEYEKTIAALESERDDYKDKVDVLKNSTANDWEKAKSDVNKAYRKTETSLKKGWKEFKEGVSDVAGDVKDGVKKAADDVKKKMK